MFRRIGAALAVFLLVVAPAGAIPLDTYQTFVGGGRADAQLVGNQAILVRGSGTRNFYYLEVDPTTGRLPVDASVSFSDPDVNFVDSVDNDYTTDPVTTGAWVELIGSTASTITRMSIFDSCGQVLELGTGAAGFEARKFLIPPGGIDQQVFLTIASGSRISVRAVSDDCTEGRLVITFVGT